jgi:hypothetical protein
MKNPFKKKEEVKTCTTKYVVYFNRPKESLVDSSWYLSTSWTPTEFDSLHNAREFAENQAKYYDCYVAEITPLFKYSNATTEEAM